MLESLFNNIVGLKACNFIKKRLQHRCFPLNIAKFLKTAFFIEHLYWLLLFMLVLCSYFEEKAVLEYFDDFIGYINVFATRYLWKYLRKKSTAKIWQTGSYIQKQPPEVFY